jgi:hypothetical protein
MTIPATEDHRFRLPSAGKVAPFPREKFLKFLSKLKVQSKDYGLVPFRLLGSQLYILDELCKGREAGISTFLILKARQMGATTFFIALDLFWSFEHKGLLGTFVLHKEEARDDWRATIEVFYHEIPTKTVIDGRSVRFKPATVHHNRNILSFANGSRFRYLIAGTGENRKGGLGRSGASNYTHMTEAAFYGNEDDLAAFTSSTSSIYPHRMFIKETTANGFNHFAEEWEDGQRSKTKCCIFVGWWRDERNQFATDHDFYSYFMPDSSLSSLERSRVRAVRAEYEFQISLQQIAWYRCKLQEEFHGDQSMMDQEFPWTADDAFQATGAKYFTTASLTAAVRTARRIRYFGYRYRMTNRWEDITVQAWADQRAELRIWEQASKFGYYAIGCDPAYGSSDEANRNVISVWRCYAEGMEQVAEFCSSQASTYHTAWALAHLAGFYGTNDARVLLELNGPGKAVFAELQQIRNDLRQMRPSPDNHELRNCLNRMHDFFYKRIDNPGGSEFTYHWVMTEDLKRMLMARFKDAFELDRIKIRSVPLLEEMRKIVNDEGHIAAEGAGNDDRVIGAALAYECYGRWMRQRLMGMGMTRAHAQVIEANGGESQVHRMVTSFLKRSNIALPQT